MNSSREKKLFAILRIVFGCVWLVDAAFKWNPVFLNSLPGYLEPQGQPAAISWWINLWLAIINTHPHFFAVAIALAETLLGLALIFGLFTRTAIILGSLFALLIWTTAEGFGGPYMAGSTDIGAAIMYVFIFAALWIGQSWKVYSLDTKIKRGKEKVVLIFLGFIFLLAIIVFIVWSHGFAFHKLLLLNPKGTIAGAELAAALKAVLLMLVLAVPTYIFTIFTIRKYRAGNKNVKDIDNDEEEEAKSNPLVIAAWWIAPAIVVFFVGTITWTSAHALDPFRPIQSTTPPVKVEVVAMRWKWLFIYPAQGIATVNFLEIPVNTPVHFDLASDDAPMNSFWIPQLSGQIYTMTGMSTQLNLMATSKGDFSGRGAEISGPGFSGMTFTVRSASLADFNSWISSVKQSPNALDNTAYQALLQPSENVPVNYYANVENGLYSDIINKYMPMDMSTSTDMNMNDMSNMQM